MAIPREHDLTHHSDFEALVSPDGGYISICGYGSLLSERSARTTFPDLVNFRIARLTGFRRLFSVTGGFFFTHRIANTKTQEIAALSVEPCEGEVIVVAVFEIKKTEIPAFIEREREYRFLAVVPESLDGKPFTNPAVLCASYTDEEFFKFKCSGNVTTYKFVLLYKRAGKGIFNNTENIRSIRFGGMMLYHAVFIFVTVSWLQKALVMKPTITFWIIPSLLTVKRPYVSTLRKWVQTSWKKSHPSL